MVLILVGCSTLTKTHAVAVPSTIRPSLQAASSCRNRLLKCAGSKERGKDKQKDGKPENCFFHSFLQWIRERDLDARNVR